MDGWMFAHLYCKSPFSLPPSSTEVAVTHHSHSFSSPLFSPGERGDAYRLMLQWKKGGEGEVQEERERGASE